MSDNPMLARNKTLGELRRKLRARTSFITQGPGAEANQELLNDILQEGQEFILAKAGASILNRRCVVRLSAGSFLYDWHDDDEDQDIDPGWVTGVWVQVGESCREPLLQGITERQREGSDLRDYPTRYDTLNGQLEVWPIPGGPYDLVINYTVNQTRLEQDSDRPCVPWRLLLAYGISIAKAHYRHPDAQVAGQTFNSMLDSYKTRQHENRRYLAGAVSTSSAQVVRTADGRFILGQ